MSPIKAIDTCSFAFPTREILRYIIKAWSIYESYLSMFSKNIIKALDFPKEEYNEARSTMSRQEFIDYLAEQISDFAIPLESFVEMLDDSGVEKAVHINEDVESTTGVKPLPNSYFGKIVKEYPDKLMCFAGVDPHKKKKAVDEAETALTKYELSGITIYPFKHLLYADDPLYYPIYEVAIRYDVPVWIHTSMNWNTEISMDYGHPKYIDHLAIKYPKLKIIAGHAGWPWINEMVAVAWRHSNVYIELSAFRPKYVGMSGSGFESLLYYGDRVIKDKVVWGSTWLLLGMFHKNILEEMKLLPIRPETLNKWIYYNAKKLFNI